MGRAKEFEKVRKEKAQELLQRSSEDDDYVIQLSLVTKTCREAKKKVKSFVADIATFFSVVDEPCDKINKIWFAR